MIELRKFGEPRLLFGHNQSIEDPRDGLTLFGTLDDGKPFGIRWGVIGTSDGIKRFKKWVERINTPIYDVVEESQPKDARPPFLGFETTFRIPWSAKPALEIEVPETDILGCVYLEDAHQRVYKTVDLFSTRILKAVTNEESQADIWFVVIPDYIHKYCRPKSVVEARLRIGSKVKIAPRVLKQLRSQTSFLPEYQEDNVAPYYFELNFHNQLKARLLKSRALTQIIRESTIAPWDFPDSWGKPARGMDKMQAAVAWNISTAVFYKCGGRPWKINEIRDGVCYIGLVFKQLPENTTGGNACCAAQMFLDSGDGVVFKGNVGPWYNPEDGDYHLDRKAAANLIGLALDTYKGKMNQPPSELFIHGKVDFNDEEWAGFREAAGSKTNLVGVRIKESNELKLFRKSKMPVLRGIAYIHSKRKAYLWSRGYVPRLQTYPGREVPNPLLVDVCRGRVEIDVVLNDLLALTKLNYNTCVFADGVPVTLRFANAVGEILTAGPLTRDDKIEPPLPFKHYI
ncbi:MAG: hypothetical protein M1546_18430 [Chloroflexi bacterium]|nr:hypothetical protein [Chloroflexota bacterium]